MPIISDDIFARIEQTLETKPLTTNISAFKLTRTMRAVEDAPKWMLGVLQDTVESGIATNQAITDFMEGKVKFINRTVDFVLVPPTTLAQVHRFGYVHAMDESQEHISKVNSDPINAPEDWQLIDNRQGSHMIFTAEGEVLPIGLRFDYMEGMIRDGYYDIKKLVDFLKAHDQVHPVKEGDDIEVLDVPYYNRGDGCNKCCEFIFSPTTDQMKMIWEKAKELGGKWPSTKLREAIFELDVIGLRKAGVCKVDNYWG